MDILVKCECGKEFIGKSYRIRNGRDKFCSQECKYKYRLRPSRLIYIKHKENPTSFKEGIAPWNKGTIGFCKQNKTSFKEGEHNSIKTEFRTETSVNEKNYNWKGDDVKYGALHTYIQRKLGKADHCEFCRITTSTLYVWHNVDGQYRRNINDWISLCHKCHMKLHHKVKMEYRIKYKEK